MEQKSPSTYGPPNWASFKSPITASPKAIKLQESPDFSPYSFSSPVKYQSRNKRGSGRKYFNNSSGIFSSSGNFSSPISQHHFNRRSRGNYHRFNRESSDNFNISLYFHPSMLEDPWEELEQKLRIQSNESSEKSASPKDLNNDTSVQN